MSILELLLCRKEDEESVERREQKRLQREAERRFARNEQNVYRNHEAPPMDELEEQQQQPQRCKRNQPHIQERALSRRASHRSAKRKQNIRNYLKDPTSRAARIIHGGGGGGGIEGSSSQQTLETLDATNESDEYCCGEEDAFHNEGCLDDEQFGLRIEEEEDACAHDDEEDLYDCMYHKTIRWCPSVEEEQERRRVHREHFPVKKGGIARRVRSFRSSSNNGMKMEYFADEEDEGSLSAYSMTQDSIADTLDDEDLEKMVSEYRKMVTESLQAY